MSNTKYNTGETQWEYGEEYQASTYRWDTQKLHGPCPLCGLPTHSYGGGYSCPSLYCPKSSNIFACSAGPMPDWWNTGIQVMKDGSMWVSFGPDFINLQESEAGFGLTPDEAVKEYRKTITPNQ
jgi:hypothetical protein